MEIGRFFLNGDIKGAIAYMRGHEEFADILPAYVAIFENEDYRRFEIPDMLNDILRFCGSFCRRRTRAARATATPPPPRG